MPSLKPLAPAPAPGLAAKPLPQDRVPGPRDPQRYRVGIGPSAIEGTGAFAQEDIPAGHKIGEIRGQFIDAKLARERARAAERSSGHVFMIAISERRSIDASASTDVLRFANHSCSPNMFMKVQQGRVALYALHAIAAGQELSLDYGPTHHAGRLPCRCGSPRCKGRL